MSLLFLFSDTYTKKVLVCLVAMYLGL